MEQTSHRHPLTGSKARQQQLDELVIRVVQRDSASLLRLSRRHSLCADDAEDAYQRGLEIFIKNASRLDPERAAGWLRTVIKHEAMAIRSTRQRDLTANEVDFDQIEGDRLATPEEQALGFEHVARSAEALGRLKPQEVRALWLRAQGNSYDEIQEQTGWTRTKVNRCLYEGRRAFLSRYAGIESGEECKRWSPSLSALVDGEATTEQLVELRPHLRQCGACRGVVRELHRANTPLAAVFPVGLVAVVGAQSDAAGNVFMRAYESLTSWATERSASSLIKAQALTEGLIGAAGKATAVVAATAAAASGSAVVLDQVVGRSTSTAKLALVTAQTANKKAGNQQRRAERRAQHQSRQRSQRAQQVALTPLAPPSSSEPAAQPQGQSASQSAEPSQPARAEMGLE